jgi:hypothetical protein
VTGYDATIRTFQDARQDFLTGSRYGGREGVAMSLLHPVRVLLGSLVVMGFTSSVFAQSVPRLEISGGYQLTRIEAETIPAGWYVDVAGNVSRFLALVGEVSGLHDAVDESVSSGSVTFTATGKVRMHTFLGGVRFNARPGPGVTPYLQVLFGSARLSSTITGTVSGSAPTILSESQTEPILQIGGGVDLALGRRAAVRVGVDHRRILVDGDSSTGVRISTGLVLRF